MESKKTLGIICPVFRNELRALIKDRDVLIHEMGYDVHSRPDRMEQQLEEGISIALQNGYDLRLLVGKDCECDTPIKKLAQQNKGKVLSEKNCIEAFLGRDKTLELQKDRTVLITPSWIDMVQSNIEDGIWTLEDARINFGWFDRILLLDTGMTELSDETLINFFDIVQVPVEIVPIELTHFHEVVEKLLH